LEFFRKYSLQKLWWDRFALHKLVLCHALGCINSARALFL
jgi:hypothetical protein